MPRIRREVGITQEESQPILADVAVADANAASHQQAGMLSEFVAPASAAHSRKFQPVVTTIAEQRC